MTNELGFGFSIGRVDPELYGLAAGTGEPRILGLNDRSDSGFEEWMKSYVNVLCINSWQVLGILCFPVCS